MTADPWLRLFNLLDNGWPGSLDPQDAKALRVLLDGIGFDRIEQGIKRLLHQGATFRPSAAEILAAARHDPTRPTLEEAIVLIRSALRARPPKPWTWPDEGARQRAIHEARRAALTDSHPLVASFADRMGLDRIDALLADVTPGEDRHGRRTDPATWARKELRDAWDRHITATEGREIAALAAGTGHEGVRRLDPLTALGLNPPAPAVAALARGTPTSTDTEAG